MIKRKAAISISELPKRSHKLSIDDVSKIYGGCVPLHGECLTECECCEEGGEYFVGMTCNYNTTTHGRNCWANYNHGWVK
jgi:hypothetical protein